IKMYHARGFRRRQTKRRRAPPASRSSSAGTSDGATYQGAAPLAARPFTLPDLNERRRLSHRPLRLHGARALRIDRDRHAFLPLENHQRRVDPAALVVELDVIAGEEFGRAFARVHGADRLGHLALVADAGLLHRLLENPHVAVGAQDVLGEPWLAGAL